MRTRTAVLLSAALTAALVAGAPPAAASEPTATAWVYKSADPCVRNHVGLLHGDYHAGALHGTLQYWQRNYFVLPPFWECKIIKFAPTGWLAMQRVWDKWMPDSHGVWDWRVCQTNGYQFNDSRAYYLAARTDYVQKPDGGSYCGLGDYRATNGTYIWANGEWRGGWLTHAGWHHFPYHHKEYVMQFGTDAPPPPPEGRPATDHGPPPDGPATAEMLAAQAARLAADGAHVEVIDGLEVTVDTK